MNNDVSSITWMYEDNKKSIEPVRSFISVNSLNKYWKIINIATRGYDGKVLLTKDGKHEMIRWSLVSIVKGKKFFIQFLCMKDALDESLKCFDIVEFNESEPSLDVSPLTIGVNKGKPKNYVDNTKAKPVKADSSVVIEGV